MLRAFDFKKDFDNPKKSIVHMTIISDAILNLENLDIH